MLGKDNVRKNERDIVRVKQLLDRCDVVVEAIQR